jgi:hypothetical protein
MSAAFRVTTASKACVWVGVQGAPVGCGLVPFGAADKAPGFCVVARCQGLAAQVVDGFFVHRHQAGAGTGFDGHVADRHAAFHAERANGRAGKLNRVARATGGADLADDGQHDVFGGDAGRHLAVHLHQQVLGLLGQQRLRGHHVLDFAGADAVRQCAKGAVGGGVRIAADDGHARQRGAVFRADDVHDALALVHEREERRRADLRHVVVQRGDLLFADRVGDAVVALLPAGGGGVVVGRGNNGAHAPDLAPGLAQALKRLGAGDFVHQMAVDVEDGRAVFLGVDDVLVPDLVVQGASHGVLFFQVGR